MKSHITPQFFFFFAPDRLSSFENLSPATATRPRERGPTFLSRTFHSPPLCFCVGLGVWEEGKKSRRSFDFQILFSNITTRSEREDDRTLRLAHNRARI
jgi:hypothetical protein